MERFSVMVCVDHDHEFHCDGCIYYSLSTNCFPDIEELNHIKDNIINDMMSYDSQYQDFAIKELEEIVED